MKKDNSTNNINRNIINSICGTAHTLSVIGGRWKPTILHLLLLGKMRYSELKRIIPGISERMLVLQLRELEKGGIVKRIVYPEVPPRVEYELTKTGLSMKDMLESISRWGHSHKSSQKTADKDIDKARLSERLATLCDKE